jgi:hypothetical protein
MNSKGLQSNWLFFFVWPLLTMVLAIKNRTITPNLIWAFVVFYGLTFVISTDNQNSDIVRYIRYADFLHNSDFSFSEFVSSLYKVDSRKTADVVQPLLTFFIANTTSDTSYLIVLFAFVFGFFYSRNVWFIYNNISRHFNYLLLLFFAVFVLVVPFWNINGFRFWTAAHVLFFGVITTLTSNKIKGVLICLFSILFHFSYFLPVFIFIIFLFFRKRLSIFLVFFIISFFINNFPISQYKQAVSKYLPEVFLARSDPYIGERGIEKFSTRDDSHKNWYAIYYKKSLIWSLSVLIIILGLRFRRYIIENSFIKHMFSFTFLLFGVANILALFPSGVRFSLLSCLFASACCLLFISRFKNSTVKSYYRFFVPFLLFFTWVSIREGFNSIGLGTLFSNPILALFIGDDLALIDILKWRF